MSPPALLRPPRLRVPRRADRARQQMHPYSFPPTVPNRRDARALPRPSRGPALRSATLAPKGTCPPFDVKARSFSAATSSAAKKVLSASRIPRPEEERSSAVAEPKRMGSSASGRRSVTASRNAIAWRVASVDRSASVRPPFSATGAIGLLRMAASRSRILRSAFRIHRGISHTLVDIGL